MKSSVAVVVIVRRPSLADLGCDAECVGERFIQKLPEIKRVLLTDIEAIYNGDPAASSFEEIILCYPGFYAAMIYRLAHELYLLKLPLLKASKSSLMTVSSPVLTL